MAYAMPHPAGMSDDDSDDDDGDFFLEKRTRFAFSQRKKKRKSPPVKDKTPVTEWEAGFTDVEQEGPTEDLSYSERKAAAFDDYGAPDQRPQSSYKPFLLHRRQLNFNVNDCNQRWEEGTNNDKIDQSTFPPSHVFSVYRGDIGKLKTLYDNDAVRVDTAEEFETMMGHLEKQRMVTMDFEFNDDHSYLGMTVIIQIGTLERDYIINVFPVHEHIVQRFKQFMERKNVLKVMCGSDNDILNMKRDYFIFPVTVLDFQYVFQGIIAKGLLRNWADRMGISFQDYRSWYIANIGERDSTTPVEVVKRQEQVAATKRMSFETIAQYFFPNIKLSKGAQVADFRPRSSSSSSYNQLLCYARDDVHILFKAIQMTINLLQEHEMSVLHDAFATTKLRLKVKYHRPRFNRVLPNGLPSLSPADMDKFQIIVDWRETYAKSIDEKPSAMFTEFQLCHLLQRLPSSVEEVEERTQQPKGRRKLLTPSESVSLWGETLLRLLQKGRTYWNHIMSLQCHHCGLREGHVAAMCQYPQKMTRIELTKEQKVHQNFRRQGNKKQRLRIRTDIQENTRQLCLEINNAENITAEYFMELSERLKNLKDAVQDQLKSQQQQHLVLIFKKMMEDLEWSERDLGKIRVG